MHLSLLSFIALALGVSAAPSPQVIDYQALVDVYGIITPSGAPLAATATAATVPFNAAAASASAASASVATTVGTTQPTASPDDGNSDDGDLDGSSRRKREEIIMEKRDAACAQQKSQSSYFLSPTSSVSDFANNVTYSSLAMNAGTVVADQTNTFTIASNDTSSWMNLNAAANAAGYLGYYTLVTYDPLACEAKCVSQAASAKSGNKCVAFNIYIERDPSLNPGTGCTNPAPITNVKCSLYSMPIDLSPKTASNFGQMRSAFTVAIAASNVYNLVTTPVPIAGYAKPDALPGAINAPLDNHQDTYMGTASFKTADPNNCATQCDVITAREKAYYPAGHNYKTCNYFNYYLLQKNGAVIQQVCSFYSEPWDPKYAVNTGYTDYATKDVYTIIESAGYTKSNIKRTDMLVPSQTLTFETDEYSTSGGGYYYPGYLDFLPEIQGFKFKNDDVASGPYNTAVILYANGLTYYPLVTKTTSNFGLCDYFHKACHVTADGFTFDIISLDLADLDLGQGTILLQGLQGDKVVVSKTLSKDAGGFQTFDALSSAFTNLDSIIISSSLKLICIDNFIITKYPKTTSTKRSTIDSTANMAQEWLARDDPTIITLTNGTVLSAPSDCGIGGLTFGQCGSVISQ